MSLVYITSQNYHLNTDQIVKIGPLVQRDPALDDSVPDIAYIRLVNGGGCSVTPIEREYLINIIQHGLRQTSVPF